MPSLLAFLIDQLRAATCFTRSSTGRVYLLRVHPSFSRQDHAEALDHLAKDGVINDFRYIDAIPTPSVIAIR